MRPDPAPPGGYRAYVICTTPRSGSTLLCRLLAATGVAGRPDSHFHADTLAGWLTLHDLDPARFAGRRAALEAVLEAARGAGRGDNGLFGLRLQGGRTAISCSRSCRCCIRKCRGIRTASPPPSVRPSFCA